MHQSFLIQSIRSFSSSAARGKAACSIVKPVHHLVKIDKSRLSPRFPELKYDKSDIRSPGFRPRNTHQDRVEEHYLNVLQPDLLLINYQHNATVQEGLKRRAWSGNSTYQINRPLKKPKGSRAELPNIHPVKWNNIPHIEKVTLNCYVREARDNEMLTIGAALQLQQITGVKPEIIYSKSDVPSWKLRRSQQMGAKVELTGYEMNQFLVTLSEIVLPRIREYKGINDTSGDGFGNLSFGLSASEITYFPEINANQDVWPKTFGMHINIVTSAETTNRAKTLVSGYQVPFK
ncbi:hypothetical protein KAFR_0E02760 [Kazachstania africana CBS 2517]|uniref:Large ribosomal subunit protein uL5m n=1 Tax=Kazachstania africana (strain ATCC 22294 / BCRC 22015 / CBS 2517 / CECT 1963 / NBRC 1671 / NRRL Y-8276) TaxID=1071382 RepID=H2AVM8_KAZAF|nr:hypothetical protein KAFR_0E02760 [Kazachstania africana CBS 2517]CCF58428.1 hypothetical protein KAFR_0E02760 [Kazachstania africana CBS 2517]